MSTGQQLALAALDELYERVDELLAERKPRCEMSGRCCNFAAEDHQLWASDLEVAHALAGVDGVVPEAPGGSCPWWRSGLCTLREGRPLGCRLYFCDPSWADEMGGVYELFHQQLRDLHAAHELPYSYRLFVDAVRQRPSAETPTP